jgi:hypothetical protein
MVCIPAAELDKIADRLRLCYSAAEHPSTNHVPQKIVSIEHLARNGRRLCLRAKFVRCSAALIKSPATSPADPPTVLEDCQKLCRCRVRLRALYLDLGLKPIVQIVTVSPSALLVKFVGALLNLLLNRDQDGRLVRFRGAELFQQQIDNGGAQA